MNTYDQEVFAYLTQPDNYRAAKQISSQISQVDSRLIELFWQSVSNELQRIITEPDWKVTMNLENEWFSIHRIGWTNIGINCDQLYGSPDFGIHCPSEAFDRNKVSILLAPIRANEGNGRSTQAWPYFNSLGYDFRQQSTLESILPERRESTVQLVTTKIIAFLKKYASILEEIEREAKIVH